MCQICARLHGIDTTCVLQQPGTVDALPLAAGQTYSLDQIADQLVTGFWRWNGAPWIAEGYETVSFAVRSGGTITVNISELSAEGQKLARWALEAWHDASGLNFVETRLASADILFQDTDYGAYAGPYFVTGNRIDQALVNIGRDWLEAYGTTRDSYAMQTYIHEIGHALGLGHAGNYNGDAVYSLDRLYDNDTVQITIMSYFSAENIGASDANAVTPMIADLTAIARLYGPVAGIRAGDTTYGLGGSSDDYLGRMISFITGTAAPNRSEWQGGAVAFTLVDSGGHNHINFSNDSQAQRVDLRGGAVSDIYGMRGAMVIAPQTLIQDYTAGSGADRVIGNSAANRLRGLDGNDSLSGQAGDDRLEGGSGHDLLNGGPGYDMAEFSMSGRAVHADLTTGRATGQGNDRLLTVEGLRGGTGADWLGGDGQPNSLLGAGGADSLYGGGGGDRLIGGAGGDVLDGGRGDDLLFGSLASLLSPAQMGPVAQARLGLAGGSAAGSLLADSFAPLAAGLSVAGDRMWGGDGNDRIFGSGANDRLVAGTGRDLITGGAGQDSFIFLSAAEMGAPGAEDQILDFQSGHDVIDLTALNLVSLRQGGLTGSAGQAAFQPDTGRIEVDLDGDGQADGALIVMGDAMSRADILI